MESVTEFMFSTYFPFMQKIKTVPSSERSEVSLLSDFNTTQSGFPLPGTRYIGYNSVKLAYYMSTLTKMEAITLDCLSTK